MTETEEISTSLEEIKDIVDVGGNDISALLLKRFDAMESKLYELSKPPVKKKREPTERQILALENARVKKMENVAIRKQLKEEKKKTLKEESKAEVKEYRAKAEIKPVEDVIEEDVAEVVADIPPEPTPQPNPRSRAKNSRPTKTNSVSNLEYDTYENQPNQKRGGGSARDRMKNLFK